jgi:hypothetical protein
MSFRGLVIPIMLATAATGCTRYGVSGPEDLGLASRFDPQINLATMTTTLDPAQPDKKIARNEVLNRWLIRSDYLCADYQLQLSRSIRDTRLATDFLATVLAGLATIFAQPAVTRPLAGSATIALGVGGDIQSDLFLQQAGDVVGTAIQAVRTRARTELQKKFTAKYADYTLEQGLVDVQRYDRETCNLNVGLNEIRASLNIIGPVAPQANDPIVPLPPPAAGTGAGQLSASATSGAASPVVTTTIPPIVQPTSQGGFVFTPGKVVTTPAVVPPPPAPLAGSPIQLQPPPGAIQGVEEKLPPSAPPRNLPQAPKNRFGLFELGLTGREISQIQTALCVPADGDLGPHGSKTRQAIRQYLDGRNQLDPHNTSDTLTPRIGTFLFEAVDDIGNCAGKGFLNAYEVGAFGVPASSAEARIKELQGVLKDILTGSDLVLNGKFDPETRKAIAAVRAKKGIVPGLGDQIDHDFDRRIR